MQRRVSLWILGTFCISLSAEIKAIVGLTPIHLHLQKLSERFHFKAYSLLVNYIIKLILEVRLSDNIKPHSLSLNKLTPRQCTIIKSPIIDRFNEIIPFFSPFNSEFSLENRLVNVFPNQFYSVNRKSNNNVKSHLTKLNNLILCTLSNPQLVIVVTDMSIQSQVTTLVFHVHCHDRPIIKTLHYAVNVMTTEAELFAIRCGINQAIHLPNIKKIFFVINSIHASRRIFDSSSHLYQSQLAAILGELREFFKRNINNSIKFWDCSSNHKWPLYHKWATHWL